jgi:hypothetical protein
VLGILKSLSTAGSPSPANWHKQRDWRSPDFNKGLQRDFSELVALT